MEKRSKKLHLNFFKKKKILITGINGFKGFWLYFLLNNLGAKVFGIGIENKDFIIFKKFGLKKKKFFNKINISNYKSLKKYINTKNPDLIFHLASESLVINCHQNPLKAINTNILGLANLLLIIRDMKYKKKLGLNIVTSDKCYLPKYKKAFKENDRLGGNDIYSSTKACQEILTQSFYKSYLKKNKKIYVNTLRAGNVVGGGDYSKNRLFPDIYRSIKNNSVLSIRNKNSTRPWQHVLDTLYGYLLAAQYSYSKKINYSNWNFSPKSNSKTVNDLLKLIINECDLNKKNISYKKNIIKETKYLNLNSDKAKNTLKWNSFYDLNQTIKDTFSVYEILDKNIKNSEKIKLLRKRVEFYLKNIYGNTHRS